MGPWGEAAKASGAGSGRASSIFPDRRDRLLNHAYLISFIMVFLPAHRCLSVDAWLRPSLRTETIPAWPVQALRAQKGVVYVFGGIAKLEPDWPRRVFRWPRATPPVGAAGGIGWTPGHRLVAVGLAAWFCVQLALPLRHWAYPGRAVWTEEGQFFAWRMMLPRS